MSAGKDDVAVEDASQVVRITAVAAVGVPDDSTAGVSVRKRSAAQKLKNKLKKQRWKERRKRKLDKVAAANGEGGGGPLMLNGGNENGASQSSANVFDPKHLEYLRSCFKDDDSEEEGADSTADTMDSVTRDSSSAISSITQEPSKSVTPDASAAGTQDCSTAITQDYAAMDHSILAIHQKEHHASYYLQMVLYGAYLLLNGT